MNVVRPSAIGLLVIIAPFGSADAEPTQSNIALESVLHKLEAQATVEQSRQITEAIAASPHLQEQLQSLVSGGKLTDILILSDEKAKAAAKPGPFNAWISGASIVFSESILLQLAKNRNLDVAHPDERLPNNTTFVLGHLAYQLNAGPPNPRGYSDMQAFVSAMVSRDAHAYIQAWNDVLDAAVRANEGRQLTPQQIGGLMLNLRYRFAFTKALQQSDPKLEIAQNGEVLDTDRNAQAIATALRTSAVADIQ